MQDCVIQVTTSGKNAVGNMMSVLGKIGLSDVADNGSGDNDTIVVGVDVVSNFPVGSCVKHVGDGTFHRVLSAVYSGGVTTIELASASTSTFASRTDIRAYRVPRIINSTLLTVDSDTVSGDVPAIIANCNLSHDISGTMANMVSSPSNVIDSNLVSIAGDF